MLDEYITSLCETLYMVGVSATLSIIFGFVISLVLVTTGRKDLNENKIIYQVLDFIINIFRSLPFIILMIILIPLTRLLVGKSIGTTAAIVPLTIAAIPFAARIFEASLNKINHGLVETSKAFGLTTIHILFKVIVRESIPYLVLDVTLLIINLIGYSAMAGAIGGRGLGDLAIRYGYQGFNTQVMIITVIMLIMLVQIIQLVGNSIYKILIKKISR
ncbi:D-methionine transport system permease protein [Hathewaya proteolytica DSM 3090]|uniref:D-methionine transport system permease protein n=1 Tax=Hathewaya proteolytica DSM 3090 TaxID=1121331 RepID=A0A1M6QNX6_9CLOT|nr:methionine ABC transporter permease [Hathewaya proteolytica]SHK21790.1 D-methionine transport system permease protein [Hathewaya proteolytica DSM 3090]